MNEGPTPDEALVSWTARGESAAFDTLYRRHSPWVRAWAAHTLGAGAADDVLQDVFVSVWRAAPQFDPQRGQFTTWLAAIARHHMSRQLERRGGEHRALAAASVEAALAGDEPSAGDIAVRNAHSHLVLTALRALPDDQRRVIVLGYFAGMSQSEMAAHLGVPLGTVKKRVRLAMQKLRESVAASNGVNPRLRVVPRMQLESDP